MSLKEFSFSKRFPEIPLLSASFTKNNPDLIPLSFGYPAAETFPINHIIEAVGPALEAQGKKALQYTGGPGSRTILDWVKERSRLRSIEVETERILITSGSGQGIDLVTRTLTDPGDEVWVEAPTFFGALRNFRLAEVKLRAFPLDKDGLQVDVLEAALIEAKQKNLALPKMVYVISNYHNPGGVSLSLERRKKLAELAYEYNFFILEDDAYVELNFTKEFIPAIYSFAPERVIYLSTFSKVLAPGLRLAWAIAEPEVIQKVRMLKSDGNTSVFVQEVINQMLQNFDLEAHLNNSISLYQSRRDIMMTEIDKHLKGHVTYNVPSGGFFLWLTFAEHIDTGKILQLAKQYGVTYIEGKQFYCEKPENHHLRLCFAYCQEEEIKRGIAGIAKAYYELYPEE